MKFLLSIPLIFIFSLRVAESLVLISFDGIEKYFQSVRTLGERARTNTIITETGLSENTCHILRQSRIFHMQYNKEAGKKEQFSSLFYIESRKLQQERNQLRSLPKKQKLKVGSDTLTLDTISCLNLEGKFHVFISRGYIRNTAFVFVMPKSSILTPNYPVLSALIDDSAEIRTSHNIHQKFIESWKTSSKKKGNNGKDPLCSLTNLLKYRLCVLSADALENHNSPASRPQMRGDRTDSSEEYEDLTENFYYEPTNTDDSCPNVNVTLPENTTRGSTALSSNLLYCYVEIKRNTHEFFLSQNAMGKIKNVAYLIQENKFTKEYVVKYDITIPLLSNIDKYYKV